MLRLVSIVEDSDFRVIIILPEHGNVEDELVNKGIKYYVVKQYIWNYWIKYLSHTKNIFYYLKLPLKYLLNRISFHKINRIITVSYTHLRAHETVLDLVCRLLLEKKNFLLTPILFSSLLHISFSFYLFYSVPLE
ncbi:hypothetical protein PVA38_10750 [Streptococcus pneumoniae D39]|nr:hypothetical protein PVA38_10750 [Streptococcus pneumoniae D39]